MPDPATLHEALGAGWLTKAAIAVFGGGGLVAAWVNGRESGKAAYLNSVATAADLVIRNRGDEITRLNGVVDELREDFAEERANCDRQLTELWRLIEELRGNPSPIPPYTSADIDRAARIGAQARKRVEKP